MEDDPQDWLPLTAFYHYAGPSQSNAPSTTTTNASPPPIAVTTTYTDGTTTSTTNHTAPVTILIFHNPIHPSFDKEDDDDDDKNSNNKNNNNNNNNNSDPPLDPSRRCAGCRNDFASTVVADDDDIAAFPVFAGPHCDCTFHAGCLAQPYFDRATMLPVRRGNMACPACGGKGFGEGAEMGCWEDDDDDEWEKGAGGGDGEDEGGDGDDDDDDIVQFEMPRSAVVTEGMVVIRLESEWDEEQEVEATEGAASRRAVVFALIVKWASGDDGEGEKEGEEGMQAQQDGEMPGDSVLPGCEQRLASLALDQPQQQQKIQEKTVASAEEKEDVGPAA